MTPKEKAKELINKFDKAVNTNSNTPLKKCALVAVDEIINNKNGSLEYESDIEYWKEVKQEIGLL